MMTSIENICLVVVEIALTAVLSVALLALIVFLIDIVNSLLSK